MNWSKGFTSSYYVRKVDPGSWRALERYEITGGQIKHADTDLRESADIECRNYSLGEAWIRIYLDVKQAGSSDHIALFTGLASSPEDEIDGMRISQDVQLYSVLKPCDDVLLERGWYAPAGTNGAMEVARLLSVTPAPVMAEGSSPALKSAIIAEDGETRLSMADKILDAIGWRLRITGDGTVTICAMSDEAVASFDATRNDALEPKIKRSYDWFDCPNVFRAIDDDMMAVARDESAESPLSTVNRGREIWQEETSCTLNTGESLAEYALRRLKELQQVGVSLSYDRRYHPEVMVSDVINLNYPVQSITGKHRVVSQTIELGHGARVSEEVVKI